MGAILMEELVREGSNHRDLMDALALHCIDGRYR